MPVRNGEVFLDEAVASIRRQAFSDFEFVVVDDGSTDGTASLLARHAAEDDRIRVFAATGAGIVDALNQALAAARGDLLARMDADDIAEPGRFARQVAEMDARRDLVLLGTAATEIDGRGSAVGTIRPETDPARLLELLRELNPFLHPTVVMRRNAVEAAGGYRRSFALAEDYDLWIRLAREGVVANLPDALLRLRRHPNQLSRRHRLEQRAVHALARILAYGPPLEVPDLGKMASAGEAILTYVRAFVASGAELTVRERRDVERMLRWLLSVEAMSRAERRQVAATLRGGPPTFSSLLLRLRLRFKP